MFVYKPTDGKKKGGKELSKKKGGFNGKRKRQGAWRKGK